MPDSEVGADELHELLATLSETIILIDRNRTVRYMNRTADGYAPESVVGTDALDYVESEFRDVQEELYEQVLETGEPATYEVPVTDAEGERQWHEGTLHPLIRDGEVDGFVMVTRNVTERHQAKAEAEKLRELLPVCSWCGKIRDDEGYWQKVEAYIEDHSDVRVTHGMCPECEPKVRSQEAGGAD